MFFGDYVYWVNSSTGAIDRGTIKRTGEVCTVELLGESKDLVEVHPSRLTTYEPTAASVESPKLPRLNLSSLLDSKAYVGKQDLSNLPAIRNLESAKLSSTPNSTTPTTLTPEPASESKSEDSPDDSDTARNTLVFLADRVSKRGTDFGAPTASQLEKINALRPAGSNPIDQSEVVVIRLIAADNLIDRSRGRFDVGSLRTITKLLPGLPALKNHDWELTDSSYGRIFDAKLERIESPPKELLDRSGNLALNQEIASEEGVYQVHYWTSVPAFSSTVEDFRLGKLSEVSIGGFRFQDIICPTCSKESGKRTSFADSDACPHFIPDAMVHTAYGKVFYGEEFVAHFAPYFTRFGVFDLTEASAVNTPKLPATGVIRAG